MARLGWLGMALPEDAGGAGGGMTELGILMSACGQGLLLEPLLATAVLGAAAIERAGSPQQKAELLAKVAAGELLLAFAHGEPMGGYDRGYVRTIATKTGSGWRLDGAKTFALHADCADQIIVSARVGGSDGRLGLVPRAQGRQGAASQGEPCDRRPVRRRDRDEGGRGAGDGAARDRRRGCSGCDRRRARSWRAGGVRRGVRRHAGGQCDDARLSQAAQAVRQDARRASRCCSIASST